MMESLKMEQTAVPEVPAGYRHRAGLLLLKCNSTGNQRFVEYLA